MGRRRKAGLGRRLLAALGGLLVGPALVILYKSLEPLWSLP